MRVLRTSARFKKAASLSWVKGKSKSKISPREIYVEPLFQRGGQSLPLQREI